MGLGFGLGFVLGFGLGLGFGFGLGFVSLVQGPVAHAAYDGHAIQGILEAEGVVVDVRTVLEVGVPQGGGLGLELLPHGVPDA